MHTTQVLNARTQKVMIWSGVVLVTAECFGLIALARFLPVPSPELTSDQVVAMFQANTTGIRAACVVMMLAGPLWLTWASVIVMWLRRMDSDYPSMTIAAVGCLGFQIVIWESFPLAWAVASFRPGDIAPDITRTLNDIGWFAFVFTWPPFSLQCLLFAVAVLRNRSTPVPVPRWVGYMNIWVAITLSPGILIVFFKSGPFAYNGLFSVYVPLALFFGYMLAMTVVLLRANTAEHTLLEDSGAHPLRAAQSANTVDENA